MSITKSRVLIAEAKRKTVHICGAAIPLLYLVLQKDVIILGFLLAFVFIASIEWLRFRGIISLPFLRKKEEKEIGAYVFFFIGAFLSILLFEKSIAIVAILILSIGDAASALTGAVVNVDNQGWYEKRMKRPEVVLVMFITTLLIGFLLLQSLPVAVFGALGATIADGVPVRVYDVQLDDNLTIPLFSGLLMSLISFF